MAFTKPNVNTIWSSDGAIIEPALAKIVQGWVEEIPDFEFENWIQNRQDAFNAHVNERGIAEWDATTNYITGKSYVQGSDGNIYKARTDNTNKNPVTSSTDWQLAFADFGSSYDKTSSDSRYLKVSSNLGDLSNAASARSNLSVYSKVESDGRYQSQGIMLGMVAPFAGSTSPSGWLVCDGSEVSRSAYAALFNYIGTLYGSGDGTTTFNLPDLRDDFIRGANGATRLVGTRESDQIKSHNHTGTTNTSGSHTHSGSTSGAGSHTHNVLGNTTTNGNNQVGPITYGLTGNYSSDQQKNPAGGLVQSSGYHSHTLTINAGGAHTHTFTTDTTGGSETRPRNVAMLYCIKY